MDPLDPSAAGYTERYDHHSRRAERAPADIVSEGSIVEKGVPPISSQASSHVLVQELISESSPSPVGGRSDVRDDKEGSFENGSVGDDASDEDNDRSDADNSEYSDEEERGRSDEEAIEEAEMPAPFPAPFIPPATVLSADELLRRRLATQDTTDSPLAGPSFFVPPTGMPSAQELLNRRLLVTGDLNDSNSEDGDDYFVPTAARPSAEELMSRRYATAGSIEDGEENEYDDKSGDVQPWGPVGRPDYSRTEAEFRYSDGSDAEDVAMPVTIAGVASKAHFNPSSNVEVPSAPQSGAVLQMFAAYGDSDDSDDQKSESDFTHARLSVSVTQTEAESRREKSAVGTLPVQAPAESTSSSNHVAHSSLKHIPEPSTKSAVGLPKAARVDSELTGFVPSALRLKRQRADQASHAGAAKLKITMGTGLNAKKQRTLTAFEADSSTGLSSNHISLDQASGVDNTAIGLVLPRSDAVTKDGPVSNNDDDEYAKFMKEIDDIESMTS